MDLKKLNKFLENKNDEFLRDEIVMLYQKFEAVKEYYRVRLQPEKTDDIVQKYKAVLKKQIYPFRGFPELKYSIARKAITDFKKVCRDPAAIIDMQLTYVEY